jgi:hypothetical protein
MKLNPEELVVSSFETSAAAAGAGALQPIIITPNDPTAATWCYICPAETERCW